jgi:hypothetical protein
MDKMQLNQRELARTSPCESGFLQIIVRGRLRNWLNSRDAGLATPRRPWRPGG